MIEELPQVFWEIHNNLPREGPGDNKSTKKAFQMLQDLPKNPHIIDIACGPGMQTIQLAKLSEGKIVALDFYQPFLEQLKANAKKEGLDDKIDTINGDMLNLNFEDESFDLVWSEGAIYIIGFEKGLREWKRLLTPKGYVVVSEMSWLQPDLPDEVLEFMKIGYPAIKTVEENIDVLKKCGYRIINSFVLQTKSWWDNYYNWIEAKLPALKAKYENDKKILEYISCEELEMEMFRKYSEYYGYVFFIMQNK